VLLGFHPLPPIRIPLDRRALYQLGPVSQVQMKSLAVDGSGAAVLQWKRQAKTTFSIDPEVEEGSSVHRHQARSTPPYDHFLQHMQAADRERFRPRCFGRCRRNQGGDLQTEFASSVRTGPIFGTSFEPAAAASDTTRVLRCVGLMRDITSLKRSHERLMHDAVHDSLTSLPNRELFMDRLQGAITRAREGKANRPTVMFIDIDRFKNVNKSFGLASAIACS
jgi:hypothetical protein